MERKGLNRLKTHRAVAENTGTLRLRGLERPGRHLDASAPPRRRQPRPATASPPLVAISPASLPLAPPRRRQPRPEAAVAQPTALSEVPPPVPQSCAWALRRLLGARAAPGAAADAKGIVCTAYLSSLSPLALVPCLPRSFLSGSPQERLSVPFSSRERSSRGLLCLALGKQSQTSFSPLPDSCLYSLTPHLSSLFSPFLLRFFRFTGTRK